MKYTMAEIEQFETIMRIVETLVPDSIKFIHDYVMWASYHSSNCNPSIVQKDESWASVMLEDYQLVCQAHRYTESTSEPKRINLVDILDPTAKSDIVEEITKFIISNS